MKWEKLVGGWKAAHGWFFFLFVYTFRERELSPALPNSSRALYCGKREIFSPYCFTYVFQVCTQCPFL